MCVCMYVCVRVIVCVLGKNVRKAVYAILTFGEMCIMDGESFDRSFKRDQYV